MKKTIKKILIITQVLGSCALVASACTEEQVKSTIQTSSNNNTNKTTNNSDQTSIKKDQTNDGKSDQLMTDGMDEHKKNDGEGKSQDQLNNAESGKAGGEKGNPGPVFEPNKKGIQGTMSEPQGSQPTGGKVSETGTENAKSHPQSDTGSKAMTGSKAESKDDIHGRTQDHQESSNSMSSEGTPTEITPSPNKGPEGSKTVRQPGESADPSVSGTQKTGESADQVSPQHHKQIS